MEVESGLLSFDRGNVTLETLTTQQRLTQLATSTLLPGETAEVWAGKNSLYSGVFRRTSESIGSASTVSFTTANGLYSIEFGDITEQATDIVDLAVFAAGGSEYSSVLDLLFLVSGSYDAETLKLNVQKSSPALENSTLTNPVQVTMPFPTEKSSDIEVYVLAESGFWELDQNITVTIIAKDTIEFSSLRARPFWVSSVKRTVDDSKECGKELFPIYAMGIFVAMLFPLTMIALRMEIKEHSKKDGDGSPIEIEDVQLETSEHKSKEPEPISLSEVFNANHLLFGQLKKTHISRPKRALELLFSILLNIVIIGLLLATFRSPEDEPEDDQSVQEFLILGGFAAVMAWLINGIFEFTMIQWKPDLKTLSVLSCFLMLVGVLASMAVISIYSIRFCSNWSTMWVMTVPIALIADLFLLQSVTAGIKTCVIYKRETSSD